jgi:hypothetical protein
VAFKAAEIVDGSFAVKAVPARFSRVMIRAYFPQTRTGRIDEV